MSSTGVAVRSQRRLLSVREGVARNSLPHQYLQLHGSVRWVQMSFMQICYEHTWAMAAARPLTELSAPLILSQRDIRYECAIESDEGIIAEAVGRLLFFLDVIPQPRMDETRNLLRMGSAAEGQATEK